MLYNLSTLEDFSLGALDGEIGSVEDFYFDDQAWTIRYLVAGTGNWLSGRTVLISPAALRKVNFDDNRIEVKLTQEQIRNSPDIDTHKPISRQHESALHDYYGFPYYWGGPYLWGPVAYPGAIVPPPEAVEQNSQERELRAVEEKHRLEDQHLRSTREVTGYTIEASDGDIGHVEDFLIEDGNWTIRYAVVDTRNWWPGKHVLVPPRWIIGVDWSASKARIDVPREQIKQAPEYANDMSITRDYEESVYRHYQRPGYW